MRHTEREKRWIVELTQARRLAAKEQYVDAAAWARRLSGRIEQAIAEARDPGERLRLEGFRALVQTARADIERAREAWTARLAERARARREGAEAEMARPLPLPPPAPAG